MLAVDQFDRATLLAQPDHTRYGSGGLPIPHSSVRRAVIPSDPHTIRTKEAYERYQAEKKGHDSGLRQNFETVSQADEFRKRNGIVRMTNQEFESEIGDPSGPMFGDLRKKFERRMHLADPGLPSAVKIGGVMVGADPSKIMVGGGTPYAQLAAGRAG